MSDDQEGQEKPRKPQDTLFRQQNLPAWRPLLTPGNLYPFFLFFGILCIAIGVPLYYFDGQVQEAIIDYTKICMTENNQSCHEFSSPGAACNCTVNFNLTEDWQPPVIMYYGLTNFYQNHRSYVKSRDDNQLLGNIFQPSDPACSPLDKSQNSSYIPCGAIANSLFSDSITLSYIKNGTMKQPVGLNRTGIALDVDKKYKFKNPSLEKFGTLEAAFRNASYIRPRDWHRDIWELDTEDENNNGLQNEDLMVWMRTAALPNFRKIYRRINHEGNFENSLPKGQYRLNIQYRYNVTAFGGTKSIILSNTSILGGKNNFFGIAYISFGIICIILAFLLFFIETMKRPGTFKS